MEQGTAAAQADASTTTRKRPHSRASTTSVHSGSAAPLASMEQAGFHDVAGMYAGPWVPADHSYRHNERGISLPAQIPAEENMMQTTHQLQAANHAYQMDGVMGGSLVNQHIIFHQHQPIIRHPLPSEQYGGNASFTEGENQMLERDENDELDSVTGTMGVSRPTTRSSANNEHEMRQLFHANRTRSLEAVAAELHGNERGPNSERTRQVFAMLWINSVCAKGQGSVPRGRVYANYASRCATERITVLNPASFGKLVRVLFPGLKTRRLGVRGESKYHYVNFALLEEQGDQRDSQPPAQRRVTAPDHSAQSSSTNTKTYPENAKKRASEPLAPVRSPSRKRIEEVPAAFHSVYNNPDLDNIESVHSTSAKTKLKLSFVPSEEQNMQVSEPLALPVIEAYLPAGTDPDAAKSLSALYRSHCTSIIECIRYCREKAFFHLYTSFQGTLTMPVQKLFGHHSLAPWVESCDYALYQRAMCIIASLTLQVVPKPVLDTLRNISERLVAHIRESFQGQPQHVIAAKEAPAAIFAGLLDRALRVNLTAHAAAKMLANPANRDQMYADWITMIRTRKIAECVPSRGMDDVVDLLLTEMRDLLDPIDVPWDMECLTIYGAVAARSSQAAADDNAEAAGHNVLDRWVSLLQRLPARFPYASDKDIVWCVERVGTAVMRSLTLAQGQSFGSWWVTKTWLDEMICFLAENGGFMKQTFHEPYRDRSRPSREAVGPAAVSRQGSRYSSGIELPTKERQSQPGRAPFPAPRGNTREMKTDHQAGGDEGGDGHDDSGIGIQTPDEEAVPAGKLGYRQTLRMGMMPHADMAVAVAGM